MSSRSRVRRLRFGIAAIAVTVIGISWWFLRQHAERYRPSPMSFDGTSDQLLQTVILPTLDSSIPDDKNAIWCASFQIAWNRLKDDVAKEPIRLANAESIADAQNRAEQSENDVEPDAVYAAAGLAKDGIVKRIQTEMASKFPSVARPELNVPSGGAVAYVYLAASSKFDCHTSRMTSLFSSRTQEARKRRLAHSASERKMSTHIVHCGSRSRCCTIRWTRFCGENLNSSLTFVRHRSPTKLCWRGLAANIPWRRRWTMFSTGSRHSPRMPSCRI